MIEAPYVHRTQLWRFILRLRLAFHAVDWLPLLVNLAGATAIRMAVPSTFAASGERYRYYLMGLMFPYPGCPSFHCFRFLPPLLTSLLPFDVSDAFVVTGFLCEVLAGTMLWLIAERLHASRRIALLTTGWFWATWGPIQSFNDPLLITDPVQAVWSLASLHLLLSGRPLAALPLLISGAAVKESVLLVPVVYVGYSWLTGQTARRNWLWSIGLLAAPALAWLLLRLWLTRTFDYVTSEDVAYVSRTYLFGVWLPNLGQWPRNLIPAALYIFGAFGAAWILGVFGLLSVNRRQRALTAASIPAMLFLALFQVPDRALACFPYAVLIPAAWYLRRVPWSLVTVLLVVNAAFTVRMNATVAWLPRTPVLLALLAMSVAVAIYFARRQATSAEDGGDSTRVPVHDRGDGVLTPGLASLWTMRSRQRWTLAGAALLVTLSLLFLFKRLDADSRVVRLDLATDEIGRYLATRDIALAEDDGAGAPGLALSPDGTYIAFVGRSESGVRELWLRRAEWLGVQHVPHTEGASAPFWSPDGRWIGFFADGMLKRVEVATGRVESIAPAPDGRGGAWNSANVIVFAPSASGILSQVPAAGGAVTPATAPDPQTASRSHRWPSFLPDGDHFLFVVREPHASAGGLYVGSLRSTAAIRIAEQVNNAAYVRPFLVFSRLDGTVWAQPFELGGFELRAFPFQVMNDVATDTHAGRGAFAVSNTTLVAAAASHLTVPPRTELQWLDRTGTLVYRTGQAGAASPMLSPDPRWAAIEIPDSAEIWRWDGWRHERARLTVDAVSERTPVWSPGGTEIAYLTQGRSADRSQLFRRRIGGTGQSIIADGIPETAVLTSWSPDGRVLLYQEQSATVPVWRIWAVSAVDGSKPVPLIQGSGTVGGQAQFSPDGKWIAYSSDESGRQEVYVQPYPPTGRRWHVSPDGGAQPRWRADMKELVYVVRDRRFTAVSIDTARAFQSGLPRLLFERRLAPESEHSHVFQYAMTPDAQGFLTNVAMGPEPKVPLRMVMNWQRAFTTADPLARYVTH